jgi:hypothetical protein
MAILAINLTLTCVQLVIKGKGLGLDAPTKFIDPDKRRYQNQGSP